MMNKQVRAVEVWLDEQADDGVHRAPSRPWTVSTVNDQGDEVTCVGSYASEEEADLAAREYADEHGLRVIGG